MTAANNPTRVVAVGESSSTQDQIIYALDSSNQTEFQLVDVIVPNDARIIDAKDKTVMPGLIDAQSRLFLLGSASSWRK